jgi:prepilin-type N-terminal cleavage/methylation domain-containing protein
MNTKQGGFTLPELAIAIVIATVIGGALVVSVIGWLGQYAIGSARQDMTITMQSALSRMSDDIRQSYAVLVENAETDANAPTTPGTWRTASDRLVLARTPFQSDGTALYTNATLFNGKPDSIVYYLNNGSLYRRIVPANYAGNVALPLVTCSSPATGGCPTDTLILSNITSLQLTYYDSSDNSGAVPASTRSVLVDITTTKQQSGQTVTVKDKVRTNLQQFANLVPPPTDGNGTDPPPGPTQATAGLVAGPGGLQATFSNITGRDAYIKGRVLTSSIANINLNNYRMDVGNVGCGARTSYPATCSGLQPIANAFFSSVTASPICATSAQTTTYGLTGLQSGCTPPAQIMPVFNKASFTSTMAVGPSSVSCNGFSTVTLAANQSIAGDVKANACYKLTIAGNVYIKGNLSLAGFANMQVAEGVTTRPIIVVNQQVDIKAANIKPNSAGITPYIISFYSPNATCSSSDSCNTLTNPEIYDAVTTSPNAISLSGYSNVQASLYAYFGTLNISTSNVTGAIAGQKIIVGSLSGVQLTEGKWPT